MKSPHTISPPALVSSCSNKDIQRKFNYQEIEQKLDPKSPAANAAETTEKRENDDFPILSDASSPTARARQQAGRPPDRRSQIRGATQPRRRRCTAVPSALRAEGGGSSLCLGAPLLLRARRARPLHAARPALIGTPRRPCPRLRVGGGSSPCRPRRTAPAKAAAQARRRPCPALRAAEGGGELVVPSRVAPPLPRPLRGRSSPCPASRGSRAARPSWISPRSPPLPPSRAPRRIRIPREQGAAAESRRNAGGEGDGGRRRGRRGGEARRGGREQRGWRRGAGAGGSMGSKNKDGTLQFPVFHRKHPCLESPSSSSSSRSSIIHPADDAYLLPEASPVVANDVVHKGKFFMVISLGTPAVFNLVTIDTGSTLSWMQCRTCQIRCHTHLPEVGPIFDPLNSTTYQHVACSSQDSAAVNERLGVLSGCVEEKDTCLYSLRYGSAGPLAQYSVGRLGKDRLRLALSDDYGVVDGFVFGCSEDVRFEGREAGVIGFGNETFSFLNQVMAAQANNGYRAFSYCFPGNHGAQGFLSIGPYAKDGNLGFTNLIFGYDETIRQLDMMVDGQRLDVDPSVYASQMMIVDSGTAATFLLAPVFDALDKAVTAAMAARGYARHQLQDEENTVCFWIAAGETTSDDNWSDLPTVELKFTGTILNLPPQNVFDQRFIDADGRLVCLPFQPRAAGVSGVQILGNKATRSFRIVFDLQARMFGFQPDAC
ncbi:hypothetical protein C2845_PM01G43080 [Panicum miliaceum]|uniref:Peptidase A1 domain-containing protein n=1 Tax=Panicum miliaceum TaxID=4540 RepID=A0A3L6TUE5_PANMI|nr:hypothetical protein C2845_PM01G43080 [Panicum miliaceum]